MIFKNKTKSHFLPFNLLRFSKEIFYKTILLLLLILPTLSFTHCAGPSIFQPTPLNVTPPIIAQPIEMAIDEVNKRGYLINSDNTVLYSNGSLIVFDLTNPVVPTVLRSVGLPNFSGQAYLDTATKYLYVTNRLNEPSTNNTNQILKINIDEASSNYLTYQQYESASNPFGITSNGTDLFVVDQQSLDFYALSNLSSRTNVNFNVQLTDGTTPNTSNTRQIALSPSKNFLYVTNETGPVLILNTSEIPAPSGSAGVTNGGNAAVDYAIANTSSTFGVASDSQYIYIVEGTPPALLILNDVNLPVVQGNPQSIQTSSLAAQTIPLGTNPNEIALDPTNNRAYVTLSFDNQVSVIDTKNLVELVRIPLANNNNVTLPAGINQGENPFAISLGHFGGTPYIYVMNLNTNNISIINGSTNTLVSTFP